MKFKNFLPLPKTPRLKALGSWKKSVNESFKFINKKLEEYKVDRKQKEKEIP